MNTTDMRIPSNRVRDIERYFLSELKPYYPEPEIRQFVRMLFQHIMGWDTVHFMLNRESTINQSDLLKFHWAAEDLKKYRPIQHIIGQCEFCGCTLEVNSSVLIPRPETEEIVEKTLSLLPHRDEHPAVLDICTGSGCIAIAIAKAIPNAKVYAIDLSSDALEVAGRNAIQNQVDVTFHKADVLNDLDSIFVLPRPGRTFLSMPSPENDNCKETNFDTSYDIIISNPPYVKASERENMRRNVCDYEPSMALFVSDDDPLVFYRAIGRYATTHLKDKGILVFEINESLGEETSSLLRSMGFDTELQKDFRGKDRMIVCQLKDNRCSKDSKN